jgi:hypothetical protein
MESPSGPGTLHLLYSSPKPGNDFSDWFVLVVLAHAAVVPFRDVGPWFGCRVNLRANPPEVTELCSCEWDKD